MADHKYTADSIKSLDWKEHIRLRPGMYIGKLGDGSSEDDGIYVLLKEVLDNCIDEFVMGFGKQIEVECDGQVVTVRDFGRGIPLEKLLDCSSKINTGAKYDSEAFKKSVGLNGVGIKAVNALSTKFDIQAFREGKPAGLNLPAVMFSQSTRRTNRPRKKTEPRSPMFRMIPCLKSTVTAMNMWNVCFDTTPILIGAWLFVTMVNGFVPRMGSRIYSRKIFPKLRSIPLSISRGMISRSLSLTSISTAKITFLLSTGKTPPRGDPSERLS